MHTLPNTPLPNSKSSQFSLFPTRYILNSISSQLDIFPTRYLPNSISSGYIYSTFQTYLTCKPSPTSRYPQPHVTPNPLVMPSPTPFPATHFPIIISNMARNNYIARNRFKICICHCSMVLFIVC